MDPEEEKEYRRQVEESDVTPLSLSLFLSCFHHNQIDWCFSKFGFSLMIQSWNCECGQGFDVDCFRYARIKPYPLKDENAYTYDVELFGRLGLHCYNLLHKVNKQYLSCFFLFFCFLFVIVFSDFFVTQFLLFLMFEFCLYFQGTNLKLLCIPKYNTLDIALTCGY